MKWLRHILTGILVSCFLTGTVMALGLALDHHAGNEAYGSALRLAFGSEMATPPGMPAVTESLSTATEPAAVQANIFLPQNTKPKEPDSAGRSTSEAAPIFDLQAPWLEDLDLEALREVNPDVIGWILIPGTNISYPIVQGEDNSYYLDHTWDGRQNATGAVFMEATHAANFSGFSTILYAHNLRNGTMFTALHNYKDRAFWEAHPFVYIATDTGNFRYRIYAAYEAEVTGTTYWQHVDTQLQQEYVQYGLEHSVLDTGVVPADGSPILTLSTCTGYTYARRWVVQAVLEGPITGDLS